MNPGNASLKRERALIIVSATSSSGSEGQELLALRQRAFLSGPARQIYPVKEIREEVPGLGIEEALGSRGAIAALDEITVGDGQGRQFPVAQAMQAVVAKGQLTIAALHSRAGTLEQLGTLQGEILDDPAFVLGQVGERTISGQEGRSELI